MREIRAHLTAKTNREIGAALELKRQSATCNRGQYRLRKPNTPLRKEVERETGDPEGNLVIVERVARERQHLFSCREYGWDGAGHVLNSTQYGRLVTHTHTRGIFRIGLMVGSVLPTY